MLDILLAEDVATNAAHDVASYLAGADMASQDRDDLPCFYDALACVDEAAQQRINKALANLITIAWAQRQQQATS